MTALIPLVNAGLKYINGLNLSPGTASTLEVNVTAGASRDSTNTNDIALEQDTLIDGSLVKLNGAYPGNLAASTAYPVYLIGDSTVGEPTGVIISTSVIDGVPEMPFGYDMFRRIGFVFVDSSSFILRFTQSGAASTRTYTFGDGDALVLAGNPTVFTAIPLAGLSFSGNAKIQYRFTPTATTDALDFSIGTGTDVYSTFLPGLAGIQVRGDAYVPTTLVAGVSTFQYKVTTGTDAVDLFLTGFEDNLS